MHRIILPQNLLIQIRRCHVSSPLVLLSFAMFLHLLAALPLILGLNLWVDEAYSLQTSGQALPQVVIQSLRFEQQPPLYFVLLSIWRWCSPSVLWARLFSLLCTMLTVLLGGHFWLRLRFKARFWPLIVLALNPFLLWAASEVRVYGLLLLESTLLLLLFWQGFWQPEGRDRLEASTSQTDTLQTDISQAKNAQAKNAQAKNAQAKNAQVKNAQAENARRWARWGYGAVAIAALYTQYYAGLLLLAQGMVLVVQRRRQLRHWLKQGAIAGLSLLPLLTFVPTQLSQAAADVTTARQESSGIKLLLRGALYVLPSWDHGVAKVSLVVLLLGAGLALSIALWSGAKEEGSGRSPLHHRALSHPSSYHQSPNNPLLLGFMLLIGTMLLGFAALAYQLGPELVQRRHTVILCVPCILFVLVLVAQLEQQLRQRQRPIPLLRGWCVLAICFYLVSLKTDYANFSKLGDWQQVSQYLMQQEQAGQPILVFTPEVAMPLDVYYNGRHPIYPLPEPEEFETYRMAQFQIHSPVQIDAVLDRLAQPRSLWLVSDRQPGRCTYAGLDLGCEVLEASLNQNYEEVQQQVFNGSWVSLWQRRPIENAGL